MLLDGFHAGGFALAALAAVLIGVAKTGVPGFGILAVPIMVLAVGDARHAAGWLLPLLCVADLAAIAVYRRHAQGRRLIGLAPWVLAGMGVGALTLAAPERSLRLLVAAIVIVMIGLRWLRGRGAAGPDAVPPAPPTTDRWWQAAGYGASAGFATTVANAAGPVMNLYLLARRLPKHEFVARARGSSSRSTSPSCRSTPATRSSTGGRSPSTWRWFPPCWSARSWAAWCWRASRRRLRQAGHGADGRRGGVAARAALIRS